MKFYRRFLFLFVLVSICGISSGDAFAAPQRFRSGPAVRLVPSPRLLAPLPKNGEVVLKDQSNCTFSWTTEGDATERRYFDFRLYKGTGMIAKNRIEKQRILSDRVELAPSRFENGQTYTWAVRQVYKNGDKSRRNFSTFKVLIQ